MNQSDWERIQEIYHAASALPPAERGVFLATACAGDPNQLREVHSLLNAAEASGEFLKTPVVRLSVVPDNLVGMTIDGRYVVERELGGGMSQVYLALDQNLRRQPVVLKVLSHELFEDSYARQKFEQEVEALLRMKHTGVARVSDTGKLGDGRPYIVMEYVDGETLRSQIPTEGMNLKRAASIVKQIGEALEHVHEKNIFHRDLKPENIMLRRDTDSVVLIDFGIAKVKESAIAATTAQGISAGTLPYMSPEQLRGDENTPGNDIYSMAIIAYEMVTGRRPFYPNSVADMVHLQREGVRPKPADLRRDLPRRAQDIIVRALSFDTKHRYQSAIEFGDKLTNALLNDEPKVSQTDKKTWSFLIRLKVIVSALIVVSLLSYGTYEYLKRIRPLPSKGFNYWLNVQKMHDGKEYQDPSKSNGDETFENGDKFKLNVFSLESGYLYIFNEGQSDNVSVRMIYPNKTTNDASATIGANQTAQSDWMTFQGPAGAENFWIVWSVSPVSELESIKNEALLDQQAGLTEQNVMRFKEFVKAIPEKASVRRYKQSQEATVRSKSDTVLTLVQFKHR